MGIDPYANCHLEIEKQDCTLDTCCLAQSSFLYRPNYGGNLFFTIFFAVFIVPQLGLSFWRRTWGFGIGMLMGLLLEVIGYAGRILLHNNPFDDSAFLLYLICITIAPVFVTAAIYLCLSRIIVLYGEHLSFFKPRTVAITFMTSDFCSLVLQAAGGGISYTSNDDAGQQAGIDVMIAGLLLQAISIGIFLTLMAMFWWRARDKAQWTRDDDKEACRSRPLFKVFLASLVLATVLILIRSIFRVVELWGGFEGKLWNDETDFLVLDGAMMALAVVLLTALHPGLAFSSQWHAANWSFKTKKDEGKYQSETSSTEK